MRRLGSCYIVEGLLKNTSEVQPTTVHGDTQAQSTPVFGLAHLLGIKLMPRIRNWKDLRFFRPSKDTRYRHIDNLFSDTIDWDLIEAHWQDLLQVVLSIKAGTVSSALLLRRLGTYSRRNRLYQAFSELGRVIRTGFLLEYLSSAQLREQSRRPPTRSTRTTGSQSGCFSAARGCFWRFTPTSRKSG